MRTFGSSAVSLRDSARGVATRLSIVILAALFATGLAGCKKKSADKPADTNAAPGAAAPHVGKTPASGQAAGGDKSTAGRHMRANMMKHLMLQPVTVDEVKPLIPAIEGATPVGQPGAGPSGRQVKAALCVSGKDATATAAAVVAWLEANGFSGVRQRVSRRSADFVTVGADKQPYRIAASVQRGTFPDCPAAGNKTKVTMMFFKRGTRAAPAAPGAAPAGAPPAP